ncbi:MAG: serine/threonine protein kinase, partial [Planctomycetota bacterium]
MSDQYERAKEVFLAVCDLGPLVRSAAIDRECGDDEALRRDVESLLTHYDSSGETSVVSHSSQETSVVSSRPVVPTKPERPDKPLERVGSYRVIRELARGGMGVVYLGEDERFKRRVAIKVVKRGMDTEAVLRRFDLERQLLAALNHPGISRLYDGGETDDGRPYFVMEYVTGMPIDDYCDAHRLSIAERMKLFKQVCLIVHHAHQNLVVHRDLKPSNILVSEDGTPKLLDFGIAKMLNPELVMGGGDLTAPESRVMTPEYASPEQVRGNPLTTGSDVYSLGVLLYELVSGHRPYQLRSRARAEVERVVCSEEPERPSTAISRVGDTEDADPTTGLTATITPESVSRVREGRPERLRRRLSGDIDNIVLMAMRKESQRRYASAEQLAEDIQRHLDGMPVVARPDNLGYRASKFISRHRVGVAAAAFIAVSLVGGIFGTTWQANVAASQRDTAARRFDSVRALARTFMFDFHDAIQTLDGSLPARELLVTTAQEYLDDLRAEGGDHPGLLRELASAYDRVGDIQGGTRNPNIGDTEGALINYQTAFELRQALTAELGEETELSLQAELASSHMRLGDVLLHSGEVPQALDHYRESLDIFEDLARSDAEYRRRF